MAAPILQLKDIKLSIGGSQLFSGLNLSIEPKSRLCIVGRNGSGKTTLMKIIAGSLEPDQGEIFIQPGIRLTHMPQEPLFPQAITALEYVQNQEGATSYNAEKALASLEISPNKGLDNLSGGEARRVSLAHALVTEPSILLLDEPTNHLDVATIEWLEKTLFNFGGSLILISHDRTFLANATTATLWLDRGIIRRLNKSYRFFDEWAEKVIEEETKTQIKMDKLIEQETEWSYKGITARRKRNQGRLNKLYELREKRSQHLKTLKLARLEASIAHESSRNIIEVRHISKTYEGRILFKDFSTNITRGDRIGIIGPNGSGKTTLLKILMGELKPDSGRIKIGKRLDQSYMDQTRATLDPRKTLWQTLCPNGGDVVNVQGKEKHVVAYLKEFLFQSEQARSPVGILSGGEKNRLLLALALANQSNLMVLDEPTNDLDMDTLDRLQDMLCAYEGTLLIVSHDRSFLDNVVTSTIVLEGDGSIIEYAGGYSDYIEQKKGAKTEKKLVYKKGISSQPAKQEKNNVSIKEKTKPSKLSFKQQFALQELPKKIDQLILLIAELEARLNDPDLYIKDPKRAQELAQQLSQAKQAKDELENQWLEIEMLIEDF